jgi:hypothetical protein
MYSASVADSDCVVVRLGGMGRTVGEWFCPCVSGTLISSESRIWDYL